MQQGRTSTLMVAGVAVVMAIGVAVGARSGSADSAAAPHAGASSTLPQRVVLPGRPGDAAQVTDSDRVRAPDGTTYNGIDATFVQMMIVHHGQAIEMAALASERTGDARLRALAGRIGSAQAPEVAFLRAWLQARRLPEDDPAHDHGTMPGMQAPADMAALAALRGAAFDRRFVTMMTAHHRGAIRMAGDVLSGGIDEQLRDVVNEMAVEQGSEIRRLEQLGLR
jgi:uncharacterized protein (DUF305 family)